MQPGTFIVGSNHTPVARQVPGQPVVVVTQTIEVVAVVAAPVVVQGELRQVPGGARVVSRNAFPPHHGPTYAGPQGTLAHNRQHHAPKATLAHRTHGTVDTSAVTGQTVIRK
jgi:hypothetical protein